MSAPVRVLIAALGGEGGGVLASWIADAAIADGYVAQRTSVPGVAQRTGGTTYYIEFARTDGRRSVLALSPAPGGCRGVRVWFPSLPPPPSPRCVQPPSAQPAQ